MEISLDIKLKAKKIKLAAFDIDGVMTDGSLIYLPDGSQAKAFNAKDGLVKLKKEFARNRKCATKEEYEYRNMLNVAGLIIACAINRKESRGAHSIADYPNTGDIPKHSAVIKQNSKELVYVE